MDEPTIPVPRPERVTVEHEADALSLGYPWFTSRYLFLALFCVFWDGFLVFWYANALRHGAPAMAILFPLIHVAVGIGITYSTIAGFANRTTVRVSSGTISIRHGPVPWLGNRDVQASDVRQLYRESLTSWWGNNRTIRYQLTAVLRQGGKRKLLAAEQADVVLFIEQEIERHLGIADVRVVGEMPK